MQFEFSEVFPGQEMHLQRTITTVFFIFFCSEIFIANFFFVVVFLL